MDKLVSIVLVTYNSSRYVIEALESIRKQTYPNIELVISDDCSSDDTVEICEKWVEEKGCRFSRVVILQHPYNTGISANFNRGFKVSKGSWIKILAGDDILLENCISDNVNYIMRNHDARVVQSNTYLIDEDSNIIGNAIPIDELFKIAPPELQFDFFALTYSCNTTTLFIERELLQEIGWIDEEIKMMEDTQLYVRLTLKGIRLCFFDSITTGYRQNFSSVSHDDRNNTIFFPSIYKYTIETYNKYVIPNIKGVKRIILRYWLFIIQFFLVNPSFNTKTRATTIVYHFLILPYILVNKFMIEITRRRIRKNINKQDSQK